MAKEDFSTLGGFTVRFEVSDLEPSQQAALLNSLLERSGLSDVILDQMSKDKDFASKINAAFEAFRNGDVR